MMQESTDQNNGFLKEVEGLELDFNLMLPLMPRLKLLPIPKQEVL